MTQGGVARCPGGAAEPLGSTTSQTLRMRAPLQSARDPLVYEIDRRLICANAGSSVSPDLRILRSFVRPTRYRTEAAMAPNQKQMCRPNNEAGALHRLRVILVRYGQGGGGAYRRGGGVVSDA